MKKFIAIVLLAAVVTGCAFAFAACGDGADVYEFYAPDGAPVLALADMWGENFEFGDDGTAEMKYSVINEANVLARMTDGSAEFIVAPLNVGANVHSGYAAGKMKYDYKLLNVTSWGVLYFTTNEDSYKTRAECADAEEFLAQFDGTSVSTIGEAAIPGKSVEYLFGEAGAEVTLNGSEATVIQQSYLKGDNVTAIFAEPAITGTNANGGNVTVLASVSEIYKEITGNDFPMSGVFVRADVLESEPELVEAVDARVKTSTEKFISDTSAVAEKAAAIEGFSLKAPVIVKAKDKLNVAYKDAAASKADVEKLLGNIGAPCDDGLFA